MNCYFCSQPTYQVPLIGDEKEDACHCGARYLSSEGGVFEYGFVVSYKMGLYYFDYYPICATSSGSRSQEYFRLTYSHFIKRGPISVILKLSYLPDFTPANALSKLPTLITFQ